VARRAQRIGIMRKGRLAIKQDTRPGDWRRAAADGADVG